MVDAGFDVLGFDQSADMVALSESLVADGRFTCASVYDVDLPRCIAVTAVGEVFNYAFDEAAGPAALSGLLARIAGALAPGGLAVFDVAGPGRLGGAGERVTFSEGDGWAIVARAREEGTTLVRDITLFRGDGDLYRRTDERHVLRLIDPDEVLAMLAAAGLRGRRLPGYIDGPRLDGWTVFRAVK